MKKKISFIIFSIFILVCTINVSCFAGVDEVKLFLSDDLDRNVYAQQATVYAGRTFEKLGYKVRKNVLTSYFVTSSKAPVLEYIQESGDNYAFFVDCHGNSNCFAMTNGDSSTYIYPSNITGGWHFVWINACECMATSNFAEAFHTVGYSKRISMGWYLTVTTGATLEWGAHFYNVAGSMGLRDACLNAAGQCENSTPIRLYGDKEWNGYAWP